VTEKVCVCEKESVCERVPECVFVKERVCERVPECVFVKGRAYV
jgi:hypothetical protein